MRLVCLSRRMGRAFQVDPLNTKTPRMLAASRGKARKGLKCLPA